MLLLTINDRPLPLPAGAAFKYTLSNPLFSDAGAYSYALSLPLALPLVSELWPALRHPYPSHALPPTPPRFRLVFTDEGQTHEVEGIVKVLGVEDEALRVQLVSGRGALTHALSLIPDLSQCTDLGAVWQFPLTPDAPARTVYTLAHHQAAINNLYADEDEFFADPLFSSPARRSKLRDNAAATERALAYAFHADQLPHAAPDAYDAHAATAPVRAVAFPTYALTSENKSVHLNVPRYYAGRYSAPGFDDEAFHTEHIPLPFSRAFPYENLVPQPNLFDLLCHVFRLVGLSFDLAAAALHFARLGLSDYWHQIRSYYLANVRPTLTLCHMLPRWSALELLTEFERFFDLSFQLDGLRLTLHPSAAPAYEHSRPRPLQHIHRHSSSYTDTTQPEASPLRPSSLSYDWATPLAFLTLPHEVIDRCHVRPYYGASVSGSLSKEEEPRRLQERRTLYTDPDSRHVYAYVRAPHLENRYALTLLDYFPPRSSAWLEREQRTLLRLVPAPLHTDGYSLAVPESITLPDNSWDVSQSLTQQSSEEVAPPSRLYLFYHEPESRHREQRSVGGRELSTPLPVSLPLYQNPQGAWFSVPTLMGSSQGFPLAGNMQALDNPRRPHPEQCLPAGRLWYEYLRDYRPAEFSSGAYASLYASRPWYFVNLCRVFDLSHLSAHSASFRQPLPAIVSGLSREFRFSDAVSSVSGVFHAFGRPYVCSKLVLTLTPSGVSPERVGTFHELPL